MCLTTTYGMCDAMTFNACLGIGIIVAFLAIMYWVLETPPPPPPPPDGDNPGQYRLLACIGGLGT